MNPGMAIATSNRELRDLLTRGVRDIELSPGAEGSADYLATFLPEESTVHVPEGTSLSVQGRGHIRITGTGTVRAVGPLTIDAHDRATLDASYHTTVRCFDHSSVSTLHSARVWAYDHSSVRATSIQQNPTVEAFDEATVDASGPINVIAHHRARITCRGGAAVFALDQTSVSLGDHGNVMTCSPGVVTLQTEQRDVQNESVDGFGTPIAALCGPTRLTHISRPITLVGKRYFATYDPGVDQSFVNHDQLTSPTP